MSTTTDSGPPQSRVQPTNEPTPPGRHVGVLGWIAAVASVVSVLLMMAVAVSGPSSAVPKLPRTWPVPPLWFPVHPGEVRVAAMVYAMVLLGTVGVVCGLIAVRRGARPNMRLLLPAAVAAVALLTLLPPAGSTDSLSYAAYGRIAAIGHSPYRMTPEQLRLSGDPVGRYTPRSWRDEPSLYGPVATATEWAAAELGGSSMARIVFWLKLLSSVAFGAVAFALDRLLRGDPAARARAHLLWTVNPLMIWDVVAGAHCDGLAAGLGFLGLVCIRPRLTRGGASAKAGRAPSPRIGQAVAAGLLIGAAAAVKAPYALLGIGPVWAARHSLRALAAMAVGAILVIVPGYLIVGHAAVRDLAIGSSLVAFDSFWRLIYHPFGFASYSTPAGLMHIAELLCVAMAALLAGRLPRGLQQLPAIRPALVVMLAWLLLWPMQRPWYDAIAFCMLAVFPASRLDWLLLVRQVPTVIVMATGVVIPIRPAWLRNIGRFMGGTVTPAVLLACVVATVLLCVVGAWQLRKLPPGPLAGLPAPGDAG